MSSALHLLPGRRPLAVRAVQLACGLSLITLGGYAQGSEPVGVRASASQTSAAGPVRTMARASDRSTFMCRKRSWTTCASASRRRGHCSTRHVNLVLQIVMGGAHATPDPMRSLSAVCHRDITLGIAFDCFYKPEGLRHAVRLQEEMNGLLGEFSGPQEVRMLWGLFADTNLRNESVRKCYYDDDTWRDLQALKKTVDGNDLFHTEFTIQLP
jgi:hypothetical protein